MNKSPKWTRWGSDASRAETASIALLFVVWGCVYLLDQAGMLV